MKKAQDKNTNKKNHLILFFAIILLITVAVFTFYQYKNSKLFTNSTDDVNVKNNSEALLNEKIKIFYDLDLIGKSSIVISDEGIINEDEALQIFQVNCFF